MKTSTCRSVVNVTLNPEPSPMADLDLSRSHAQLGLSRKPSLFVTLLNAVRDWNDARATRKMLSSLTDRELNDIGLSRSDIDGL